MQLKIGELSKRSGMTVRTLHHYDAIGLLCPSGRSASGYRLYERRDIERLHRIQALRQLDLSLADIARLLEGDTPALEAVVTGQIAALTDQIERAAGLRDRLRALQAQLRADSEPALDDWLATLAMMNLYSRYFSAHESEQLRRSGAAGNGELSTLREQLRQLMEEGAAPGSERVLPLAGRWITVSLRQMADDARLIHKIDTLHRNEAEVPLMTGIDAALLDYITRATAEYRLSLYAPHLDAADLAAAREPFLRHYRQWPALFAEARELQERGTGPLDAPALDLARRWRALFQAVWGCDPRLHEQVMNVNRLEPALISGLGMEDAAIGMVRASLDEIKRQEEEDAG